MLFVVGGWVCGILYVFVVVVVGGWICILLYSTLLCVVVWGGLVVADMFWLV